MERYARWKSRHRPPILRPMHTSSKTLGAMLLMSILSLGGCKDILSKKYYLRDFNLIVQGNVRPVKCVSEEVKTIVIERPGVTVPEPRFLNSSSNPNASSLAWAFKTDNPKACNQDYGLLYVDNFDIENGVALVSLVNREGTVLPPFSFDCSVQDEKIGSISRNLITCASADGSWLTLSVQPN